MTLFIGDIHGEFQILHTLLNRAEILEYPESIIQVGDFGHHPGWLKTAPFVKPPRPIYWIDGNHEWFPDIFEVNIVSFPRRWKGPRKSPTPEVLVPTELYPNCIYIPRGTVMEIDGNTMGFLGGGESVDKEYRTNGWNWFQEESIKQAQVDRLVDNQQKFGKPVDILVTHSPPYSYLHHILHGAQAKLLPEYGNSSAMVEQAWARLGYPTLVCGHMHTHFHHGKVHVLDINEIKEVRSVKDYS